METIVPYREMLREVLESRCAKNPRYSLRSFARDLEMAPARLSDVLSGRYGLSRAAAVKISQKLGFNETETQLFCDHVDAAHARSARVREAAKQRVSLSEASYRDLSVDSFRVISDWYHYAILELCLTEGFQSDVSWIAKRLGISVHVAASAVERLQRLELLMEKFDGALAPTDDFTTSPSGVPSEAIKKFHRQILEKALLAIDFQSFEARDFSSVILSIDRQRLPEAQAEIKKFRRSFDAQFGATKSKNAVYCLSIQFFSLVEQPVNKGDSNETR